MDDVSRAIRDAKDHIAECERSMALDAKILAGSWAAIERSREALERANAVLRELASIPWGGGRFVAPHDTNPSDER